MEQEINDKEMLRGAYEVLNYEYIMLLGTVEAINKNKIIYNALIESFALHTRNIIDFLYKKQKGKEKDTDIIAKMFFEENQELWTMPERDDKINEYWNNASKQIAHMTKSRIDIKDENKKWDTDEILSKLIPVINSFKSAIPKDNFKPDLKKSDIETDPAEDPRI